MKTNTNLLNIEQVLWSEGYSRILGLDEVGRGCLAGPVVAAGVILNPNNIPEGINDSKKLNVPQRKNLSERIRDSALFWVIRECNINEIFDLNILWASLSAMEKCVAAPNCDPDYLLVDGNRYLPTLTPHQCVVKGDSRSASIAAASIIAKVHRDELMCELHEEYPFYGWDKNMGYPTKDHYRGLEDYGISPHHRTGFNLKTVKVLTSNYKKSKNHND